MAIRISIPKLTRIVGEGIGGRFLVKDLPGYHGGMDGSDRVFVVDDADAGARLDVFLAERLAVSRAEARRVLHAGGVELAGRPASARIKGLALTAGQEVRVASFTPPRERRIVPEPEAPLSVLARGEGWIAVDKPAGSAVHPLTADQRGSVLAAVAARHPEVQGVGEGGLRSGVVHRLDVGTSGVLLVAIAGGAWQRLRAGFREHRAHKLYRAIVLGSPQLEGGEEPWLRVARHRPSRVVVAAPGAPGARPTSLRWRRLESFPGGALLEVRPTTGFLHQIRATLADLGHPVAGDEAYRGAAVDPTGASRPLLHAARLDLDEVSAESPDPPDFEEALVKLARTGPRRAR
jgi:23S rRNA pseudouridine1911/1915/1917 synthase